MQHTEAAYTMLHIRMYNATQTIHYTQFYVHAQCCMLYNNTTYVCKVTHTMLRTYTMSHTNVRTYTHATVHTHVQKHAAFSCERSVAQRLADVHECLLCCSLEAEECRHGCLEPTGVASQEAERKQTHGLSWEFLRITHTLLDNGFPSKCQHRWLQPTPP